MIESNTTDLIDKIKNTNCPDNHILISFDIKDLYTKIPVEESLTILEENLTKQNKLDSKKIQEIIKLTKITLKQNYFQYNDKIYSQD